MVIPGADLREFKRVGLAGGDSHAGVKGGCGLVGAMQA